MPVLQKEKYVRSAGEGHWIHPRFQDFHRLRMSGDREYPLHQHASYEVILVDRGPYACALNGVELVVQSHEVLVIKPGDWHQDHLRRGQRHVVLHFVLGDGAGPGATAVSLFEEGIPPSSQIAPSAGEEVPALFKALEREAVTVDEYSAVIQDATLEAFFWRLVRRFPPESLSAQFRQRSAEQEFVRRLYRVFESEVARNLAVGELAARMKVSRRTLSVKCGRLLEDSPARLFSRFKVRKAAQLLRNTDRPVKRIAYDLGFENPYHFSRVFKSFYGIPPSAVRS